MEYPNTQKRLREAKFFLGHLQQQAFATGGRLAVSRPAMPTDSEAFQFFLSAFLSAARSVTFVLQKEFGNRTAYDEWRDRWFETHSEEKGLFEFMNSRRRKSVHQGITGHRTKQETIPLTLIEVMSSGPSRGHLAYYGFHYYGPLGVEPHTIERTTYHFDFIGGSEEEVVATCSRYITFVEQFVSDFTKAHP